MPTDVTYEADRQNLIKLYESYPHAIVFVQDEADILHAINYARENDVSLRIRSGRCSTQGWCGMDNAVTIDVSELKSITIDQKRKRATAGAGVTQAELTNALTHSGLFGATGDEGILGMCSVLLGGGIGLLSRIKGIGCYNLLSVRIAVPSGSCGSKIIVANNKQNSDLLWACRGGGGGNFGVVTEFTVQLFTQPPFIVVWRIVYPFAQLIEVYNTWQHWAPFTESRLSSKITCLQSEIEVKGIFMGTLAEMGDALEPMLAVPGAVLTVNEMPFSDFYHLTTPPEEPFLKYSPMVAFKLYPSEALQIIHDFVANAPSAKSNFFSVAFGCATRHLPEGGAAVPFGKAHMYTECGAEWSNPAITTQALNWVQSFRLAMLPFFNGGYVNVLCQEIAEYEEQYYLKNARRLRSVKKRYDPQNVFYFEQSIAET